MSTEQDARYKTADELQFLRGLGTHSSASQFGRRMLLISYAQALQKRRVWDNIDRRTVAQAVENEARGI